MPHGVLLITGAPSGPTFLLIMKRERRTAVHSGLLLLLGFHLRPASCVTEQHSGDSPVSRIDDADDLDDGGRSHRPFGHSATSVNFVRHRQRADRLRKLYAAASEVDSGRVLRVCNAYAFGSAVDIFRGEAPHYTSKLTAKTGPLPYKQCFDLPGTILEPGDKLEFMVGGDLHLGTFAVTHMPEGAMLQLIIARHDEVTTAATFTSHVFEDSVEPQVAVADEYIGPSRAKLKLSRVDGQRGPSLEEPVKYNRVVTLAPGNYRWRLLDSLVGQQENEAASVDLFAENWGRYTAIRMGVKAHQGPSFDEDLMIFPGGHSTNPRNGASRVGVTSSIVCLAVISYFFGSPAARAT